VAFVLGRNGQGGSESQAKMFVTGLRDAGVHVDVILIEGDGGESGFGAQRVRTLIERRQSGWRGVVQLVTAGLQLRRQIRSGHYDVVHAVMARAYVLAPFAVPLARTRKVVAWRRNMGIHLPRRSPAAALEFVAARLTSVVICNSTEVREYWLRRKHITVGRSVVIDNALDEWRFDSVPPVKRFAGIHRVVSVGGLKPGKRHHLLVEMAAALRESHPMQVVVLGEGECRDDLVRLAEALDIDLVLPGHVADARPWLASADLYVHPSASEGMSNAILEAMAQGMAVVATDAGGTKEALGDGGIVLPIDDFPGMVDAVAHLLDEPEARTKIGRQARARARDRFGLHAMIESHLRVYHGKLGSRDGRWS
jgi:glycosyltransferase involved in cell wall biosynthesis